MERIEREQVFDNIVKPELIYKVFEGIVFDDIEKAKMLNTGEYFIKKYNTNNWVNIINAGDELFINGQYYYICRDDLKGNTKVWQQPCFNPESEKKKEVQTLNDEIKMMNESKEREILEQELERKRLEIKELKDVVEKLQIKLETVINTHQQDRIAWQNETVKLNTEISSLKVQLDNEKWRADTERKYERKADNGGGLGDTMSNIAQLGSIALDFYKTIKGTPTTATTGMPNFNMNSTANYEMKEDDYAEVKQE